MLIAPSTSHLTARFHPPHPPSLAAVWSTLLPTPASCLRASSLQVLLVTAELESVEPRKVWMKASVTDGRRATFAAGRALFVSPNIGRQLAQLFKWEREGGVRAPSKQLQAATVAQAATA